MGRIEDCFFEVLGQEKIFGSTTYIIICLEKEKQ
jgi:hypothetical protein